MIVPRRAFAGSVTLVIFLVCALAAAQADQTYRVNGKDSYQIGGADVRSEIAYQGRQTLHIAKTAHGHMYLAHVDYERNDQGALGHASGSFESTILANGEQHDDANNDPDYLTVLNQPFAVQLDAPTMRDLAGLHGSVPFDFASPMTGAPLHGTLRHITDMVINGQRVLGVAFDATGPLHGGLPDHPGLALVGKIRMSGTAYYTYRDALLLALDATLAIDGNLDDRSRRDSVAIVYKRTISALPPKTLPAPVREARR